MRAYQHHTLIIVRDLQHAVVLGVRDGLVVMTVTMTTRVTGLQDCTKLFSVSMIPPDHALTVAAAKAWRAENERQPDDPVHIARVAVLWAELDRCMKREDEYEDYASRNGIYYRMSE